MCSTPICAGGPGTETTRQLAIWDYDQIPSKASGKAQTVVCMLAGEQLKQQHKVQVEEQRQSGAGIIDSGIKGFPWGWPNV